MPIPVSVNKRLSLAIPKYQKILSQLKEKDVNESDTVTVIVDILSDVFGWDKYEEITSEYQIRGTYCDLAIKKNSKISYLIEVKAIGITLKDMHLRQVVEYASKEGVDWVILTNGIDWQVHKVIVKGKVTHDDVLKFNFLDLEPKKAEEQEMLFLLCKKGTQKLLIEDYFEKQKTINPQTIAHIIRSTPITSAIIKEMKKLRTGLKITDEQILNLLNESVIKRELISSEQAIESAKKFFKVMATKNKPKRITNSNKNNDLK